MTPEDFFASAAIKMKQGALRKGGRATDEVKLYSAWISQLEDTDLPVSRTEFRTRLISYCEQDTSATPIFKYPTAFEPEDLVRNAIIHGGFEIDAKGQRITVDGYNATLEDLQVALDVYLMHYRRDSRIKGTKDDAREVFSSTEVQRVLLQQLKVKELTTRNDLRERLSFNPENMALADRVVLQLFGDDGFQVTGDRDLAGAVFKQWLWQTKRYIHGLEVPDPLFLNFYGKTQHTGKTFLARLLGWSVAPFFEECRVSTDERKSEQWTTNYILFFDELPVADAGDIGSRNNVTAILKSLLTANEITNRVMRTTKHSTSKRTASPISATNFHLSSIIYDQSGMRRFFEISFGLLIPNQAFIAKLRVLPVVELWKGIDHTNDAGYIVAGTDMYNRMREAQQALKHRDCIEDPLEFGTGIHLPVRTEEIGVQALLDRINAASTAEEAEQMAKEAGYELINVYSLRQEFHQWCAEKMGLDIAKYLPTGDNFHHALTIRDFACTDSRFGPARRRVLCYPVVFGTNGGIGI